MNGMARMPVPDFFPTLATGPIALPEKRQILDHVGMWYAARARHGIDERMWFGLYRNGLPSAQWYTCSHRYSDGIGALPLLLRKTCFHDVGDLPKGREERQPGWRDVWLPKKSRCWPRARLYWNSLLPSLSHCQSHVPVSMLLGVMQSRAIDRAAARAGVSTTLWLLWTADRALRETLAGKHSVTSWVFPVNLRGAVTAADMHANHCSGINLHVSGNGDARKLKEQMVARLASQEHWRNWMLLTVGRWIGQSGVNILFRLFRERAGRHAGSYSNLGEWNVPGLDGISCAAPGSPAYPVSLGTVLCNGRRTLACRLHPVIGGNARLALDFLRCWRSLSLGTDEVAARTN